MNASLILKNAVIYTMDSAGTKASALAACGDKILYVGDEDGALAYADENTNIMDLQGKMVAPGFLNGHDHLSSYEQMKRNMLLLDDTSEPHSLELYSRMIQNYIDDHPHLEYVYAMGMDLQVFPDNLAENTWLNENFPDIPVAVTDVSGHGLLINQKTMDLAGITDDSPIPEGGTAYRYEDGSLTGYFSDARTIVGDVVPDMFAILKKQLEPGNEEGRKNYLEAYEEFQALANSYGMTGLDDGGEGNLRTWEFFDEYSKTGKMSMRLCLPYTTQDGPILPQVDGIIAAVTEGKAKYESDFQHINQVKNIIDGVPEGKSTLMLEPYPVEAGMGENYYGPQYSTQEEMNEFAQKIDAAGYQVLVHSMGDGGCHVCTEAYTHAMDVNGSKDPRHVIVHASLMADADIKKCGEYGIYAAVQPIWFYIDPQFSALEKAAIGEERFYREYRMRDMMEAGMTMTGGADYAVTPDFSPLSGIQCGVTQGSPYPGEKGKEEYIRNKNQTVSVYEMLKVYTINCAKQMRMEDIIGSLEPGKKADMVVLEKDITEIDPLDIAETKVCYTFFDGRIVHEG